METTFGEWLAVELEKRNMRQVELARKSGVAPAQISRILSGQRGAEGKTLRAIARALKMAPEDVFRAAGLMPDEPNADPWVDEMAYKLRLIPASLRPAAGKLIESMAEGDEASRKPKPKAKTATR